MRPISRVACIVLAVAAASSLAGCDALENFTIWDSKKPLPGDRKAVFPGGVPGVTQGIPAEYMPGYKTPEGADATAQAAATAAKEAEAKAKPAPKRVAARPKPANPPRQEAAVQAPQAAPAQAQSDGASAWPSSPSTSTFQR